MRVLLINPSGGYQHEFPPLGLLSIASVLKNESHVVGFFDEGGPRIDDLTLDDYAQAFSPEIIGVALYTSNINKTFKTITRLKSQFPGAIIIAGGPHATVMPEKSLQECWQIDYIVCGEGEYTARELIDVLQRHCDVSSVNGIFYRKEETIVRTPERDWVPDLDSISFPSHDLLADYRYSFDVCKAGKKVATVMSSRGCPYDCAFCAAKAVWRKTFRRRSPENVVKEIVWLTETHGYDEIYFMDDLFAVNRDWLDELYRQMKKYNVTVPWKCLGRVDLLTLADYQKMAENGCYLIQFGVESGDNEILKDIDKHISTDQIRKAFAEAKFAGLNTYGFFIIGHRLDTYETIMKTIYFARYLNPDFVSFFLLVPFPGTRLYDLIPDSIKHDWDRIMYTGFWRSNEPILLSSVDSKDLIKFERQAHTAIYTTFSYLKNSFLGHRRMRMLSLKLSTIYHHFKTRLYLTIKGNWIIGRYKKLDLTHHLNGSFSSIWKNYLKGTDLKKEVKWHLESRNHFFDILQKYLKQTSGLSVLEVGCGTAIDSHHLSALHHDLNFYAIDSSEEAVTIAKNTGSLMKSRVQILIDDALSLHFKDEFFDLIFSQGVLEHFPDPLPLLQEQIRVLKSGGYLVVDVPQKYNPYTLFKQNRMKEGIWEYGWETEYSRAELKRIGKLVDLIPLDFVGHGYGYNQDYGFAMIPRFIRLRAEAKNLFVAAVFKAFAFFLSFAERYFGQYFMQNITVVYKKK